MERTSQEVQLCGEEATGGMADSSRVWTKSGGYGETIYLDDVLGALVAIAEDSG
jgi:hypothetical protein